MHFGLLKSFIPNRDSRFDREFWPTLWSIIDMRLQKSNYFLPKINGQTQVVKTILVQYIRGYNRKCLETWDGSLPYIQHYFNKVNYSFTNDSSFEACLGYIRLSSLGIALNK